MNHTSIILDPVQHVQRAVWWQESSGCLFARSLQWVTPYPRREYNTWLWKFRSAIELRALAKAFAKLPSLADCSKTSRASQSYDFLNAIRWWQNTWKKLKNAWLLYTIYIYIIKDTQSKLLPKFAKMFQTHHDSNLGTPRCAGCSAPGSFSGRDGSASLHRLT